MTAFVSQEEEQTSLPTLPILSTTASTTMVATTPTPQHHHHHHNFWGVPGLFPLYDYSLLDPFGFDPFLTDPFLGDPFLYEPQLGWFRSSDEKLRELRSSDLDKVFRSTSLEQLVEEENRGWRRRKEKKERKSKRRKVQRRRKSNRRNDLNKSVSKKNLKTKVSGRQLPNSNHQKRAKKRKEGKRTKRQRRSFGVGSMSWNDVQDWRETWGKKKIEDNIQEEERKESLGKKKMEEKELERKGKEQDKEKKRRREKQKNRRKRHRGRERGAKPEKERRKKSVKSGGKVESFLAAVVSKYGGTFNPLTTQSPGRILSPEPKKMLKDVTSKAISG